MGRARAVASRDAAREYNRSFSAGRISRFFQLRGKQPKLSDRQSRELRRMYDTGDYSVSDLAEVFSVSRPTVYRTLQRQPAAT